jgi:hypothetical protein
VVINPKGKFQAALVTIFTIPDLYLWSQPEKVVHIEREDLKIIIPILRFTLAGFAGTTNTLSPPRPTIDREDFPPKKKELRYLVTPFRKAGGQGRIRTFVHLREQIYSLPPLTTRPPTQYNIGMLFVDCLTTVAVK